MKETSLSQGRTDEVVSASAVILEDPDPISYCAPNATCVKNGDIVFFCGALIAFAIFGYTFGMLVHGRRSITGA